MLERLWWLHLVWGTTLWLPNVVLPTTLNKLLILKVPCILMPTLSSCAYAACFAYHALHLKDFCSSSPVQFKCHFYYHVAFDSSQWSDPPYTPSSVSQHFIYFSILHVLLRISFNHLCAELAAKSQGIGLNVPGWNFQINIMAIFCLYLYWNYCYFKQVWEFF